MSITTMGWGSGAITTHGWGSFTELLDVLDKTSRLGFSADLKHLVIQLKMLARCKTTYVDLNDQIALGVIDLDTLEGQVAAVDSRLRNIEGEYWLVGHLEHLSSCKEEYVAIQNRIALEDPILDTIDSLVSAASSNLQNLQSQIRTLFVQRRTP